MKQNDFFQKNPQNMPTSLRYFRPKWFHLRKVKFKRDILKKKLNFFSKFFLNFFLKIASFFVAKKKNVEKNIFFFNQNILWDWTEYFKWLKNQYVLQKRLQVERLHTFWTLKIIWETDKLVLKLVKKHKKQLFSKRQNA